MNPRRKPRNRVLLTLAIWSLACNLLRHPRRVRAISGPRYRGWLRRKPLTKDQLDFFESKIRPVFTDNCYKCHSPSKGHTEIGMELDWKGGWNSRGQLWPGYCPR